MWPGGRARRRARGRAPWRPLFVWGAIEPGTGAHVLARLTADPLRAPIRAGREHVVLGWLIGREGRKSRGGAAILTPEGEVCAVSEGLWIRLRDPSSTAPSRRPV